MCEHHIDESVGDGFDTAISRDDRRPAVDPRGGAADDALIAAIADADAGRRSFGELDVGAAAQPARAHGELGTVRSEEHTSELQSLMRISYAVFCLKKKKTKKKRAKRHQPPEHHTFALFPLSRQS